MSDRVLTAARECGLLVELRRLEAAPRSLDEAADAVRCPSADIALSWVLVVDGEPVLCLTAAESAPDPELVCDLLDAAESRAATRDEARAATGFPIGSVPPLAHDVRVLVDAQLSARERIWASGGDGRTLVGLDPAALCERTGATIASIARRTASVC